MEDQELKTPAELRFGGSWKIIIPFFILPLIIVSGSVGVFYLFGKLTEYKKTPNEYLAELKSTDSHKRWQAAFELSRYIVQQKDETLDPEFERQLIAIYETSKPDEHELRTYLTVGLANIGKDKSRILFEGIVSSNPASSKDLIYALWALGKIGMKSSAAMIAPKLASEDPGVRKTAAFALGFVGSPADTAKLRALLDDEVKDVRWNSALALAELGDASGEHEILRLLDAQYLREQTPLLKEGERQEIAISAINAAAKLKLKKSMPLLATWAGSENPRARTAAIRARHEIDPKL